MKHSVAVGADDCQVFQAGLDRLVVLSKRKHVVDLTEVFAARSVNLFEVKVARFAFKVAAGEALLFLNNLPVPLESEVSYDTSSALRHGVFVFDVYRGRGVKGHHIRLFTTLAHALDLAHAINIETELEREARRRKISVAALLEVAARELPTKNSAEDESAWEQARFQQAAHKCFGALEGGTTRRSATVRQEIRRRLRQRNGC
jgi:hypothetical protein